MINRANYTAAKSFLRYQSEVLQRDPATIKRNWIWLLHIIRWADETSLTEAEAIRPVFPQYLMSHAKPDGAKISKTGVKRICTSARMFFNWLRANDVAFRGLKAAWIETLQPPRMGEDPRKERQVVTIEMVRTLIALEDGGDLKIKRDKAAAAFLFLSGMRATAFVTLPVSAVDIGRRTVKQFSEYGVRTKNKKDILTRLLEVQDLLDVVSEWDKTVRAALNESAMWYPPIEGYPARLQAGEGGFFRGGQLSKRLRELFALAGLRPMAAHKFRHGNAVYGLKQAETMADFKAVSMNLGHSSIGITDSIYAVLTDDDMQARIAALGQSSAGSAAGEVREEDLKDVVREVLKQMRGKK